MKVNVVVEVPLLQRHETITLMPPCTYCGEQAVEPGAYDAYYEDAYEWKKYEETYTLKWWARGRKFGTMQLWDLRIKGEVQKGSVTVRAPYCAQHAKGVKIFGIIDQMSTVAAFVGILIALVVLILPRVSTWDGRALLILIVIVASVAAFISFMLGNLINTLIARIKPEFRDYPSTLGAHGHWGFSIGTVRVDKGEFGVGPVRYFLSFRFLNAESARRFLTAYPTAKVTKGGELITE